MATKYLDAIGKTEPVTEAVTEPVTEPVTEAEKKKKKKRTFLEVIEDSQGAPKKLININPSGLLRAVSERQQRMDDVMRQIEKAEK